MQKLWIGWLRALDRSGERQGTRRKGSTVQWWLEGRRSQRIFVVVVCGVIPGLFLLVPPALILASAVG